MGIAFIYPFVVWYSCSGWSSRPICWGDTGWQSCVSLFTKDEGERMDCIDRKMVIEVITDYLAFSEINPIIKNMTSVKELLEKLPSVHPEQHANFCPNCGADIREKQDTHN